MDEYSSLAGTPIITPPHGKVSGLAGKRRIGERKKQKKDKKDQRKKEEDDVVIHGKIQDSVRKEERVSGEGRPGKEEQEDHTTEKEDAPTGYGKGLPAKKRKKIIDLMI